MSIIGLDCASKTGWCLLGPDGAIIDSGVQDFTKRRGESNGILFLRFRRWLNELLEVCPYLPKVIVYEQAHFRGGAATEICVGLQTRVQEIAAENKLESAPVTTTELKRFAVGKGKADKQEMIAAARKHLERDPADDNEADAILAAKWGYREFITHTKKGAAA